MGMATNAGTNLKRALLKVLSERQAELALFVKTIVLYWLNSLRDRAIMNNRQRFDQIIPVKRFSDKGGQVYFGYYDITPFSKNNKLLLAVRAPNHNSPPKHGETVAVGYFDWTCGSDFKTVDATSTWCWQQGCRLQWFPADEDELVIYNKIVNGGYGSVIQNVKTGKVEREYQAPIYSLDRSGRWAVFPSFSRLNRLRPGYGYVDLPDKSQGELAPSDDGIFLLDMETGGVDLLVALQDLAALEPLPSMLGAEHYVNHLCFSPSGRKFLFFHLWGSGHRSHARLMTYDRVNGAIDIVEDRGKVSHYTWRDEQNLLATFIYENKVAQYQSYASGRKDYATVAGGRLTSDGHPSYSPDGSMMLTDTYPDEHGDQHLILVVNENAIKELGRYHSPIMARLRYRGEARCDLHPRWDRQGAHICFDSAHEGGRSMYVMRLPTEFLSNPSVPLREDT